MQTVPLSMLLTLDDEIMDLHELYCELSISSFQGDVGPQGDKGDKVCLVL